MAQKVVTARDLSNYLSDLFKGFKRLKTAQKASASKKYAQIARFCI
jgi:hypothetical protein